MFRNRCLVLFNTIVVVYQFKLVLFNTRLVLLNAMLVLFNTSVVLYQYKLVLLSTSIVPINTIEEPSEYKFLLFSNRVKGFLSRFVPVAPKKE